MAYQSLTLRLLISAPGDVPQEDKGVVRASIERWNYTRGRWVTPTPVTVVPVDWGSSAYSQMGIRPQEALNQQFVQEADLALAMFANRLGTPTGQADSGTLEEMDLLRRAGKHVSLVRNTSVPKGSDVESAKQLLALEEYLQRVRRERLGLMFEYQSMVDLTHQIDLMLSGQALAFSLAAAETTLVTSERETSWSVEKPDPPPDPSVGVWPSVEVVETPTIDSKGRLKTRRTWYLVLSNNTGKPVRNVQYRYETRNDDVPFDLRPDTEGIPTMGPGSRQRFPILVSMQSARQAQCVVTWQYEPEGEVSLAADEVPRYETRATVRTV